MYRSNNFLFFFPCTLLMWARINHLSQKSVIFRKSVEEAQIPAFCYTIPLTRGVFQFWECWGILSRGSTKGIWDQYDSYHTTWILQHIETCTSYIDLWPVYRLGGFPQNLLAQSPSKQTKNVSRMGHSGFFFSITAY